MKKWCIPLRVIAFCVIFCLLFCAVNELMIRKNTAGAWNMTHKIGGFYNEPKGEFDVLFFGASNAYCSFVPTVLWEETGVYSYVFATQRQPIWATYTYIKEALAYQSPRLIVVDILTVCFPEEMFDEGVKHAAVDDIRPGQNKLEMSLALSEGKEALQLMLPFIKYHVRWKELGKADFTFRRNELRDPLKGYVYLDHVYDASRTSQSHISEKSEIGEKNALYLQKIIDLCKQKNIELMLVKTPNNETAEQRKYFNTVADMAAQAQVPFVNFNDHFETIGLDTKTDFYDATHLNYKGAEKFSKYFAAYASLTASDDANQTAAQWKADAQYFREKKETK